MKNLPIGIQSFEQIIEEEYIYLDKTPYLYNLIESGKYYFLSRPRRFGKSLLVSTLRCLFEGKKDLFKGLWIENKQQWKSHPVIVIDFNVISHDNPVNLEKSLQEKLLKIAGEYGITLKNGLLKENFEGLVLGLKKITGENVVILIDEYDKPLIDHIGKGEERLKIARANRDILKSFYGVIKGADVANVTRFVLLTGVSKFSRVSIFSELNNLEDITMTADYAELLGITEEEMEKYFREYIKNMAAERNTNYAAAKEHLKVFYNGYRFSKKDIKVYNPFSVLRCLKEKDFKNYWFETGTPTFLIDLIKERDYYMPDIDKLELIEEDFSTYEIESLKIESLLFQTGYVTIRDVNAPFYTLGYPNQEVRQSFTGMLFESASALGAKGRTAGIKAVMALRDGQTEKFIEGMRSIYSEIAYSLHPRKEELKENYFHTIFYLILSMSVVNMSSEVMTSRGRIDLVVEFRDKIYIIEFKCNQSSKEAIAQIKEKNYHQKYLTYGRKICLMGINFSTEKKNIEDWQAELV